MPKEWPKQVVINLEDNGDRTVTHASRQRISQNNPETKPAFKPIDRHGFGGMKYGNDLAYEPVDREKAMALSPEELKSKAGKIAQGKDETQRPGLERGKPWNRRGDIYDEPSYQETLDKWDPFKESRPR